MGGPIRRGNFNKLAARPHAVEALGMPGLHVHDLRHTGNQFAANSGAGLRVLMARMGHDSERAAMIYQHEARGADKAITDAIDKHVDEQRQDDDGDDGTAGVPVPALPNGTTAGSGDRQTKGQASETGSDLAFCMGADDGNRTRTVSLGS